MPARVTRFISSSAHEVEVYTIAVFENCQKAAAVIKLDTN